MASGPLNRCQKSNPSEMNYDLAFKKKKNSFVEIFTNAQFTYSKLSGESSMETYTAAAAAAAKSLQSCLTLCDPTDGSPPGSPVPGILQARTLEWDAISFSNA